MLAFLSVQTKELQLLYVRDSDDDIYLDKNDDDGGWSTDTQEITSTVIGLSQNSIGTVISIIYQISAGSLTYAEIGGVAPGGNLLLSHPALVGCEL